MSKKHTPGPWIAIPDPNAITQDDWCIGAQGQIDKVAVCSECDASLIAAAPELLEALLDCERNMIISTQADMNRLDRIRAAIASVKGGAA